MNAKEAAMKFLNAIKHNVIYICFIKLDTRFKKKSNYLSEYLHTHLLKVPLLELKKGLINYTSFTIALWLFYLIIKLFFRIMFLKHKTQEPT